MTLLMLMSCEAKRKYAKPLITLIFINHARKKVSIIYSL